MQSKHNTHAYKKRLLRKRRCSGSGVRNGVRRARRSDQPRLQRDWSTRPTAQRRLVQGGREDPFGRRTRRHHHEEHRDEAACQRPSDTAEQTVRRRRLRVSVVQSGHGEHHSSRTQQ